MGLSAVEGESTCSPDGSVVIGPPLSLAVSPAMFFWLKVPFSKCRIRKRQTMKGRNVSLCLPDTCQNVLLPGTSLRKKIIKSTEFGAIFLSKEKLKSN
jgi:hypothetical protein